MSRGGDTPTPPANVLYRYEQKYMCVNQDGLYLKHGTKYLNIMNDEGWRSQWREISSALSPQREYLDSHNSFEADSIDQDGSEFVVGETTYTIGEGMVMSPTPAPYVP